MYLLVIFGKVRKVGDSGCILYQITGLVEQILAVDTIGGFVFYKGDGKEKYKDGCSV